MRRTWIIGVFLSVVVVCQGCAFLMGEPLLRAAKNGDVETVKTLLNDGANIETEDGSDNTALILAVRHRQIDLVKILLDKGADINAKNWRGDTALTKAAEEDYVATVKILLEKRDHISEKNINMAFRGAARYGHLNILKLLLEKGADVNSENAAGMTALMWAAKNGHMNVLQFLLVKGADFNAVNQKGETASRIASKQGQDKIVRLLEKIENEEINKWVSEWQASEVTPTYPKPSQSTTPISRVKKKPANILGQRWAVIIGISNYQDTRIPALRFASNDAQAFYDWIVSPEGGKYTPSRVRLLIDQQATGKNIKNALFTWLNQAIAEDIVTIYFAGHGSPNEPDSTDNLFLYPYDTQYNNVAATGFPMWDIETALKRFIKAKKVIVVADACHAGGIGQPFDVAQRDDRGVGGIANPIATGLQNLCKVGDGICVISASGDKQLSKEGKEWGGGHGVFTYFLLKGLKGEADYNQDERVTLGELIPFLSEQVRRETRNTQSPTVAGKFDPALSVGR